MYLKLSTIITINPVSIVPSSSASMYHDKHSPLVIPTTPALDPTISIQKSGAWPVIPNMVVLRYLSCPARSMNVITYTSRQ